MKSSGKIQQILANDVLDTLERFPEPDENDGLMTQSLIVQSDRTVEASNYATEATNGNKDLKKSVSSSGLQLFQSLEPIVSSYNEQWQQLFDNKEQEKMVMFLYEHAVRGQLRNCHFRSIAWRMFLGVISKDFTAWSRESANWREHYNDLRRKYLRDPHLDTAATPPSVDHPLNSEQSSVWHRYFQGETVKRQIRQDVMRTFPELKFFQDPEVREILVNVLFCHSETSSLGYKQGMPEVLAPLVFVLHSDSLDLEQAYGQGSASPEVYAAARDVLDPAFMEHDAFAMFDRILRVIGRWYEVRETSLAPPVTDRETLLPRLFQSHLRGNNSSNCTSVVLHLNDLHSRHLKTHDMELYLHLERLEIAPQMYGLRWLRLLFGREFPVQDLLIIWDALFAVNTDFVLADFLYVALLIEIRDQLLAGDFATCLCLIMRYPPGVDVHHVVEYALHLYQPGRFPQPRHGISPLPTPTHSTATAAAAAVKKTTIGKKQRRGERNNTVIGTLSKLPSLTRSNSKTPVAAVSSAPPPPPLKSNTPPRLAATPTSSSAPQTPSQEMIPMSGPPLPAAGAATLPPPPYTPSSPPPLVSKYCARVLRTCSARLQDYLDTALEGEPEETAATARLDRVQMSLAEVKQVLYILSGNLTIFEDPSTAATDDGGGGDGGVVLGGLGGGLSLA